MWLVCWGWLAKYKIIGKSQLTSSVFGSSSVQLGSESFTGGSLVRDQLEGRKGQEEDVLVS